MNTGTDQLHAVRLAGTLGARVDGVDLSEPLAPDVQMAVRSALLDYLVLVFPGQNLTERQFSAFASAWGEVAPVYGPALDGYPEIGVITGHGLGRTDVWHSDLTNEPRPPLASILYNRSLPTAGGDTMFANQYLAYEMLSPSFREMLDTLRAVHTGAEFARILHREVSDFPASVHPVVRTHAETGRRALYVNGVFTSHIDGWTVEESKPLLEWLYGHCSQPNLTFRHRWSEGDVLIWDNRCVQHFAIWDYGDQRRVMHRITIVGEQPR